MVAVTGAVGVAKGATKPLEKFRRSSPPRVGEEHLFSQPETKSRLLLDCPGRFPLGAGEELVQFGGSPLPGRMPLGEHRSQRMGETLQAELAALWNEVRAATAPGAGTHTATWCAGRLPALYDRLCQTHENRYGEEITRLVRGMLKGLAQSHQVCPQAQQLEASLIDRLRRLHEQFGLPGLNLKAPVPQHLAPERPVNPMRKSKGRRKVGRKKRRMRSKIHHRK